MTLSVYRTRLNMDIQNFNPSDDTNSNQFSYDFVVADKWLMPVFGLPRMTNMHETFSLVYQTTNGTLALTNRVIIYTLSVC